MVKKYLWIVAVLFLFGCTNHLSDSDLAKIQAKLEVVDSKQDYTYGEKVDLRITLINGSNVEIQPLFSIDLGNYFGITMIDGGSAFVELNPGSPSNFRDPFALKPGETYVFNQSEYLGVKNLNDGRIENKSVRSNLVYGDNTIRAVFSFGDNWAKIGEDKHKIDNIYSNSVDLNILKDRIKR